MIFTFCEAVLDTGRNSCHTGPLQEVDSAISKLSLSLRHGSMYLAWAVECTDFSKIPRTFEAGEGPKSSRRIRF